MQTTTEQATASVIDFSSANSGLGTAKSGFDRITAFCDHFNASSDGKKLDAEEIIGKLRAADVVNDEILKALPAKDLQAVTGLSEVLTGALHKKLAGIGAEERIERIPTRLTVQSYSTRALLQKYNPHEHDSAVTEELIKRLEGKLHRNPRIIVFRPDLSVDVETSQKLLEDAQRKDPDLETVQVGNRIAYTYPIGEVPNDIVEIHPITKKTLRSNGIGADNLDWSQVPYVARQFLRLAVNAGELDSNLNRRDLNYYYNMAKAEDGLAQLQQEFPGTTRDFLRREALGNLPVLRKFRNQEENSGEIEKSFSDRK